MKRFINIIVVFSIVFSLLPPSLVHAASEFYHKADDGSLVEIENVNVVKITPDCEIHIKVGETVQFSTPLTGIMSYSGKWPPDGTLMATIEILRPFSKDKEYYVENSLSFVYDKNGYGYGGVFTGREEGDTNFLCRYGIVGIKDNTAPYLTYDTEYYEHYFTFTVIVEEPDDSLKLSITASPELAELTWPALTENIPGYLEFFRDLIIDEVVGSVAEDIVSEALSERIKKVLGPASNFKSAFDICKKIIQYVEARNRYFAFKEDITITYTLTNPNDTPATDIKYMFDFADGSAKFLYPHGVMNNNGIYGTYRPLLPILTLGANSSKSFTMRISAKNTNRDLAAITEEVLSTVSVFKGGIQYKINGEQKEITALSNPVNYTLDQSLWDFIEDANYGINKEVFNQYRFFAVACPVDVIISDRDDSPLAIVRNGDEDGVAINGLIAFADGETKYILMPQSMADDIRIGLSTTDDGEMDVVAFNSDGSNVEALTIFADVPLTKGKSFNLELTDSENARLFVLENGTHTTEISAEYLEELNKVSDWAKEEIAKAEAMGLIPDSLKNADLTKYINRVEFAAVAVKTYEALSGVSALPAVDNPFTDTNDIDVLKTYNVGIATGTSATTFDPYTLLNREQAATMLTRTFKRATIHGWTIDADGEFTLPYDKSDLFADNEQISDWAKDSVYFMAANEIIKGVGDNRFAPKNITEDEEARGYANATREQAIIIAVRMLENLR